MKPRTISRRGAPALLASVLALAPAPAAAAPRFDAVLVAGSGGQPARAFAIDARGVAVGSLTLDDDAGRVRSLVVTGSSQRSFAPLGRSWSAAYGISSAGDVAGVMGAGDEPLRAAYLRRADGTTTKLQAADTAGPLVTQALGVNAAGTVVGHYAGRDTRDVAFSWAGGVLTPRPSTLGGTASGIAAINDAGLMVGYAEIAPGVPHAAAWSPDGTLVDLGGLVAAGPSYASAVSADGWAAGSCEGLRERSSQGCLWHDGLVVRLAPLPGDALAQAWGINGAHVAVGVSEDGASHQHAVAWIDGRPQALAPLTTLPAGIALRSATGIADDGTILAQGVDARGLVVDLLLLPRRD
jgi:probable HAF family extracellular repeat protein